MNPTFDADLQNTLVRMVVPMRREFGCALDVQQMRRDAAYAQTIVAQALTSQVPALRDCARLVDYHLSAEKQTRPTSPMAPERAAAPATDLRHDAARAARLLLDLVGPMGESLAIRFERASDRAALASLVKEAGARIAGMRGEAAAANFMRQAAPEDAPSRADKAAQRVAVPN